MLSLFVGQVLQDRRGDERQDLEVRPFHVVGQQGGRQLVGVRGEVQEEADPHLPSRRLIVRGRCQI